MTDRPTPATDAEDAVDAPFKALHDPTTPVDPDPRLVRVLRERVATAQARAVGATIDDVKARIAEVGRQSPGPGTRDRTPVEPAASERHATPVSTVPIDFSASAVTPYLCVDDGAAALRFYENAFAARVTLRVEADDGTIGHAEFVIDGARFMLCDEFPDHEVTSPRRLGGSGVTLHLDVADVDGLFEQAMRCGAFPVRGPADQPHGHRTAVVTDPFGHRWMLSTETDDVGTEEFARRSPGWRVTGGGSGVPHPPDPPY